MGHGGNLRKGKQRNEKRGCGYSGPHPSFCDKARSDPDLFAWGGDVEGMPGGPGMCKSPLAAREEEENFCRVFGMANEGLAARHREAEPRLFRRLSPGNMTETLGPNRRSWMQTCAPPQDVPPACKRRLHSAEILSHPFCLVFAGQRRRHRPGHVAD
jgi:hypothetical protein